MLISEDKSHCSPAQHQSNGCEEGRENLSMQTFDRRKKGKKRRPQKQNENAIDEPESRTGKTELEEEQQEQTDELCTPTTTPTHTEKMNTSTPRRRKPRLLANLHSDLSPNYIGFGTPPLLSISDSNDAVIGYVRRTRSSTSTGKSDSLCISPRKPFVSPIDKLLSKNGSTASGILSDMKETTESVQNAFKFNANNHLTNDPPQKASSNLASATARTEVTDEKDKSVDQLLNSNATTSMESDSSENKDPESMPEDAPPIVSNLVVKEHGENQSEKTGDTLVEQSKESVEKLKTQTSSMEIPIFVQIENAGSAEGYNEMNSDYSDSKNLMQAISVEAANSEQLELHDGSEDTEMMESIHSTALNVKSPSAVSMDSAKGSSVVTGMAWMSFSTGDLFWGQIYSYCYWPCMVCPDPEGRTITTEKNVRNGDEHVMVHVRFFADNGRRNWVRRENLLPYTGLDNYKLHICEIRDKYGKKSTKYKLLMPRQSKLQVWREAIQEANLVASVLYSERLTKFYEIYENNRMLQKSGRSQRLFSTDGSIFCDSRINKPLSVAMKRDRSSSPFSPAYSPLKSKILKKRRVSISSEPDFNKTEITRSSRSNSALEHLSTTVSTNTTLNEINASVMSSMGANIQNEEMFSTKDFLKFYAAMRDFVMERNSDDELERSLVVAVRNIWALKQINQSQMQRRLLEEFDENELGSSVIGRGQGEGSVKRLSNRLRNLMIRRSLTMQTTIGESQLMAENSQDMEAKNMSAVQKPKKAINRPIEIVIEDIFRLDRKYLFKGFGRDPVCKYCFQYSGQLLKCSKVCQSWLHVDCIGKNFTTKKKNGRRAKASLSGRPSSSRKSSTTESTSALTENTTLPVENNNEIPLDVNHVTAEMETVVCKECEEGKKAVCFVCHQNESTGQTTDTLIVCNMPQCGKHFHPACCRYWPQSKITKSRNNIESFRCPSHVCHTCVSDDPKKKFQQLNSSKLTKCVKCPATYHTDSTCIPAGSQILTAAYIICPRHSSGKSDAHVNVNWCFICVGGGQLICCETCPTAVHAQCLNIALNPNEGYICEECESGRMPLYGEMVWAKFTSFRWWPAIILPPTEVPQNIMRKPHNASDFVVRFFGTHDHGWISRRRVYLYLEGDSSEPPRTKSNLDQSYVRGVQEAKRICEIIKTKQQTQRLSNENKEKIHPQPYVRIKTNRAVSPLKLHINVGKINKCECKPEADNPCGPDSNCLNRVLYHECNPKFCPAGERCQNQMFETRISPRLDVVYMRERGFGLVCREPICAGTFVIEYVGEIINDDEFKQRMNQKVSDRDDNFYFLSVEKDYIIDAGPKGNLARFMNHSCDPNCETQKWIVNGLNRIGLFAIKDIPSDTELTFNYHWDELLGTEKKTCYCGAIKCAGQIGGKYREEKLTKDTPDTSGKTKTKLSKTSKTKGRKPKPLKRLQKQPKIKIKVKQRKNNVVDDGKAKADGPINADSPDI